jgi:hypothetical protein
VAAPIINICTREGVIKAFGGLKAIVQAIPNGDGTDVDTDTLDKAIQYASGDVAAHCGNSFKVWNQAGEFPQFIVMIAEVLSVKWVWFMGSTGKATPEKVQTEYEKGLERLKSIAKAEIGLGASPDPPARQGRYPIDNSDCGRRAVYSTWRRAGYLGRR